MDGFEGFPFIDEEGEQQDFDKDQNLNKCVENNLEIDLNENQYFCEEVVLQLEPEIEDRICKYCLELRPDTISQDICRCRGLAALICMSCFR
jgi:hypothetical protein